MDEEERIEYKHRNVKDLLTEMKDVSELIVDLAYSAIIFNSEDIGQKVKELEKQMDRLKYEMRLTAMLAARTVEEAEQLAGILQVAAAAENIANAAGDIVRLLNKSIETRPFLPFVLENADEKIKLLTVKPASPVVGKTVQEVNEMEMGVRLIAIRRGKKWVYDPEESFVLSANDIIIVRGVLDGYEKLKTLMEGERNV